MKRNDFYQQVYNSLAEAPDFPGEKLARLLETMPPGSRDLPARIYLLPFGEDAGEAVPYARTATALFCSALIQDDILENDAFSEAEAVLYGDYLFALAISLLPPAAKKETYLPLLEQMSRGSEKRAARKNRGEPADGGEHGDFFRFLAADSADRAGLDEEEKERFADLAETIGALWGVLREGDPADAAPLRRKIEEKAALVSGGEELLRLTERWRTKGGER